MLSRYIIADYNLGSISSSYQDKNQCIIPIKEPQEMTLKSTYEMKLLSS